MSNRILFYSTFLVIAAMAILLFLNMTSILTGSPINQTYIKYNDVRGMAISHHNLLYTLNFQQQNRVIEILNKAVQIKENRAGNGEKATFDHIVIYQFNGKPDLMINPIGYINKNLLFSIPQMSSLGDLMEMSDGNLQTLLSQTFDP